MNVLQTFSLVTNARFGVDSASALPQQIAERGYRKPVILIDEGFAKQSVAEALLRDWENHGLKPVQIGRSRSDKEPSYSYLDVVTDTFRSCDPDVLIGIGGGSALDLAKGIGVLLRNPGKGVDYRGMHKVKNPAVPTILIPTTAGTGSEATWTASFVDTASKTKLGINGQNVDCLFSVLDPKLLVSCPVSVTAGPGLDALVHAIEAVTCRTANAVSILFGIDATRLMFASLEKAVKQPDDLDARGQTLLGSHFAGMAMRNAGGGPASGISYPAGVHYSVPHGFAGGVLLPHVVKINIDLGYVEGYARLYDALDDRDTGLRSDADKAVAFRDAFFDLYDRIQSPKTLAPWGVGRGDVEKLTDLTVDERQGNLDLNPVTFGREKVVQLLEAVTE